MKKILLFSACIAVLGDVTAMDQAIIGNEILLIYKKGNTLYQVSMTEFPSAAVIDNKKDELYEVTAQKTTNKDPNYAALEKRGISLYEYCVNGENNLPALFKETPISRKKDEAKVRTILLSYPGYPTYLIKDNQYDLKMKLDTFYDNHSTDVFDEDGRLFVHPCYITVVVTSRSANLKDAVKIAINQANSRFAPDSVHDGMPVATSDDVLDKMSGEMKPIVADSISNNTSRNAIFCNVPGPWLIREFLAVDLGFIHDLAIEMQKRDLASEILECNPMIEMLRNSEDQSSSVEHLLPDIKSIGVTPANEDKKVSLLVNAKYNERKRSIISEISETKGTFETSSMGMIIPNPQSAPSSSGPVQQMPFMGGSNYSSISTPASRYFPTSQLVPFSSRHKYESPKVKNRNLLEIINRNLLKAKNRKLPEIINHKLLKVKNRNLPEIINRNLPEIINRNLPEITNHKLPKVKNRNLLKVKKLSLTPTPSPFAINIAAIDVSKQSPSSVLPQNVQVPVHAREVYCANAPTSITCECLSFNNGTTARIVIREFLIIENNLKEHNTLHDNYCNDNNKVKFPFSPNGYITYNATGKYKKEYTFLTDDPFNAHSNIFFPDIKGWADENLGESLASPHSQKALFQIYLYSYYIWPPKK